MATYTHFEIAVPGGVHWYNVGIGDAVSAPTDTLIVLLNSDGTNTRIFGTGFTFDVNGDPTAGTISSITRTNADGLTTYEQVDGLNLSLVALLNSGAGNGPAFALIFAGVDTFNGWSGDDLFVGGANGDNFFGSTGTDFVSYDNSPIGLIADLGTPANNTGFALGDNYNNSIEGLIGSAFNDTLAGNNGNNFLIGGGGNDVLIGKAGADTLDGGAGPLDRASYITSASGLTVDLLTPANNSGDAVGDTYANIEGLEGSSFNDTLRGNNSNNFLIGREGADVLDGRGGSDSASYITATVGVTASLANPAANTGDAAGDTYVSIENLSGSNLSDTLIGDANNNFLNGRGGADALNGGAGSDTADYFLSTSGLTVDLGNAGNNTGEAAGDSFNSIENLRGSAFNDTLRGNGASNTLDGHAGADTLDGGAGNDEVRYDLDFSNGGVAGVTVNLATGTATDGFGDTDTLFSIESVRGTNQGDALTGGNAASFGFESYRGLGGNDIIAGGDGYDEVRYDLDINNGGAAGVTVNLATGFATDGFGNTDTLSGIQGVRGTAGVDTLIGSDALGFFGEGFQGLAGNDIIIGALGFDEARYDQDVFFAGGTAGVTVNLATGTATDGFGNTDTLSGIEGVRGTNQLDSLTGSDGFNFFSGLGGNDTINGAGGDDEARYDADANNGGIASVSVDLGLGTAIDGFGNTDTLISIERARGTMQADSLTGSDANNQLMGLGGADLLIGGLGFDEIRYDADFNSGGTAGVNVNLATGFAIDGFGTMDALSGIEAARGTHFADTFIGNTEDNTFYGLAGNDTIDGGDGRDWAAYSNDIFNRTESEVLSAVAVNLGAGTATDSYGGTDTLSNIENAAGGTLGDSLIGSDGDNIFRGLAGNDTINGLGGIDTVDYSTDRRYGEFVFIDGHAGVIVNLDAGTATDGFGDTDTLNSIENAIGTEFGDTLTGSASANVLTGNAGDDTLDGGAGNDVLDGGSGIDRAVFDESQANDRVVAFGSTVAVLDSANHETDRLTGVETLQFNDGDVATGSLSQFDAVDYLASYNDLIPAFGLNETAGFEHYIANGFFEGRAADTFDGFQYLASYDDLIQAFGPNETAAAQHFVSNGFAEGRSRDAFDGIQYLASYDDLIQAFGPNETAAAQHFVSNGFAEGRSRDAFDGFQYLASYDDLIQAIGPNETAAAQHFVSNGFAEGRSRDAFDGFQYLASYDDLIQAFGPNETAAAQHFVSNGFAEGRSRDAFDGFQYLASYDDLIQAIGPNETAAAQHFVSNGFAEGRSRDAFDGFQYIASYGDLIEAFGTNETAAAQHFVTNGFAEGRARDTFDAAQYLANYSDLQAAFGSDEFAATLHFIQFGFFEGRTDDLLM